MFSTTYLPIIAFSSVCVTTFCEAGAEESSCSCLDSSVSFCVSRAHVRHSQQSTTVFVATRVVEACGAERCFIRSELQRTWRLKSCLFFHFENVHFPSTCLQLTSASLCVRGSWVRVWMVCKLNTASDWLTNSHSILESQSPSLMRLSRTSLLPHRRKIKQLCSSSGV